MTKSTKTDLELLHDIKDRNSEKSKEILWNRYQGSIRGNYYKFFTFYNFLDVSLDEFKQQSYLFFLKAIDFVDFEKMEQTNSKSFATIFYYFLLKSKTSYDKEFEIKKNQFYLSDIEYTQEDSIQDSKYLEFHNLTSVSFEDEVQKKSINNIVHSYIDSLENEDKEIMELYLESKKISDISKIVKKKYHEVYTFINNVKKELCLIYQQETII